MTNRVGSRCGRPDQKAMRRELLPEIGAMMCIRNNDYETAFVKENMMGPNSLRIVAHDLPFARIILMLR
jgi:hypothetical protein